LQSGPLPFAKSFHTTHASEEKGKKMTVKNGDDKAPSAPTDEDIPVVAAVYPPGENPGHVPLGASAIAT